MPEFLFKLSLGCLLRDLSGTREAGPLNQAYLSGLFKILDLAGGTAPKLLILELISV